MRSDFHFVFCTSDVLFGEGTISYLVSRVTAERSCGTALNPPEYFRCALLLRGNEHSRTAGWSPCFLFLGCHEYLRELESVGSDGNI